MYVKNGRDPEIIPPTSVALLEHTCQPVYYAVYVWNNALVSSPHLPQLKKWSWLQPRRMQSDSTIR